MSHTESLLYRYFFVAVVVLFDYAVDMTATALHRCVLRINVRLQIRTISSIDRISFFFAVVVSTMHLNAFNDIQMNDKLENGKLLDVL